MNKDERITFLVSKEFKEELQKKAKSFGLTLSAYIKLKLQNELVSG